MCGITQREYDAWRKTQHELSQPVELITPQEGQAIYYESYWLPHCPTLPAGMDLAYFDTAVNEGTTEATKILQYSLDVAVDGIWGSNTETAVVNVGQEGSLLVVKKFTARREAVYRTFAGYRYFGRGWERRSASIGASAVEMIA